MIENIADKTTFEIQLKSSFKSFNDVKHFFKENEEMTDFAFSEFMRTTYFKEVIKYNQDKLIDVLLEQLNASKTKYSNIYCINTDRFKQFINNFLGNILINWEGISGIDNVKWNLEYLEKGKNLWGWQNIQLNPQLIDYFSDFENIEQFSDYLDWDIVSGDKRLKWNIQHVEKFKKNINFKNSISHEKYTNYNHDSLNKCFRNFFESVPEPYKMINYRVSFHIGCLSDNLYLNDGIIIKYSDLWDWWILSSNPCLSIEIVKKYSHKFDWSRLSSNTAILKSDSFFYDNLHLINMQTLSYNQGLTIEHLRYLKKYFISHITTNNNIKIIINNVQVNFPGQSFWVEVLKRPQMQWTSENIEEFREILDYAFDRSSAYEKHPIKWSSICSKLDKGTIIKYKDNLNIVSVGIENEELIWDIELTGILLDFTKNFKLEENKFSKDPFLEVLDTRNITVEAIKHFRFHWLKEYTYKSYHRNSDGTYFEYTNYPLWERLSRNKNVEKDREFYNLFKSAEFNVNQLVIYLEQNKKAIVVSNRFYPFKNIELVENVYEYFPQKDYLIFLYNEKINDFDQTNGLLDVYEFELMKL